MTTKTWDGSTNDFNLPQHWSPAGTPQNGDTSVIHSGLAELAFGDLRDAPVDLGSTDPTTPAVFANYDDFLGTVTVHGGQLASGAPQTSYAQINVSGGGDIGIGALDVGAYNPASIGVAGNLQMYIADHAQFVSTGGALAEGGSTLDVHGGSTSSFVNDSSLFDIGSHVDFQTPVIGSGVFTVGPGPRNQASDLTFDSYVTGGEQVVINGAGGPPGTAIVNDPQGFAAGVTLNPGGDLQINNAAGTLIQYQNGVLTEYNQSSKALASFQLNVPQGYGLAASHPGGNLTETTITTVAGGGYGNGSIFGIG